METNEERIDRLANMFSEQCERQLMDNPLLNIRDVIREEAKHLLRDIGVRDIDTITINLDDGKGNVTHKFDVPLSELANLWCSICLPRGERKHRT